MREAKPATIPIAMPRSAKATTSVITELTTSINGIPTTIATARATGNANHFILSPESLFTLLLVVNHGEVAVSAAVFLRFPNALRNLAHDSRLHATLNGLALNG